MVCAGPGGRFGILAASVLTLAVGVLTLGVPEPQDLATLAADLRMINPVVVVLVSALLLVALVPRSLIAAAAGLVFGAVAGATYVLAGAALGALAAFAAARWLGRDFVAAQSRLAALDGWLTARGLWGVLVLRLLPIAPFGLVSYAFGTTGVRVRAYLVGTSLAAAPSTVVYASLGASAMRPGSTPFMVSLLAALALGVGGTIVSAVMRRRRRAAIRRETALVRPS